MCSCKFTRRNFLLLTTGYYSDRHHYFSCEEVYLFPEFGTGLCCFWFSQLRDVHVFLEDGLLLCCSLFFSLTDLLSSEGPVLIPEDSLEMTS
jgi:hypothetical protein